MANIAIFRINYKSDFILTLESDAGWLTPFCIKFWTGAPSQAYFAGYDGETYTHCAPVDGEPTKLLVQFDDHHLPIGDLKFQIGYHFTVADFPTSVEDEVLNQASVIIEVNDAPAQVMLDLNGETAPEIEFSLPAYANEAQRIANEEDRIAAEQQRMANEESRIGAEETRQRNEQQRIEQETARVNEFATLKSQSQAATRNANDAATLANQQAQLAADKAALADDAATLAIQKAQLAANKAALANDAAQLANEKAALAQQKAEYAQQQGGYAKDQGDYAKDQGDYAKAQGDIAQSDHERAETDHGIAVDDHTQAGNDHTRAEADHGIAANDHTQAGNDHTRAESDHGIAANDHTQAGNDHTRAESDHGIAADDHTQAGNDHTRAESDHTRAESDHAAVEVYVDSLGAFDISAYHATGGVLAKYADLTAALGTNGANIPEALRKGGMSVKFVLSSDNKYVQARCMAQNFTTDVTQWQGVDIEMKAGSKNLAESGGVVSFASYKKSITEGWENKGYNGASNAKRLSLFIDIANMVYFGVKAPEGYKVGLSANSWVWTGTGWSSQNMLYAQEIWMTDIDFGSHTSVGFTLLADDNSDINASVGSSVVFYEDITQIINGFKYSNHKGFITFVGGGSQAAGTSGVTKAGDIYFNTNVNKFYICTSFTSSTNFKQEVFAEPVEGALYMYKNSILRYSNGSMSYVSLSIYKIDKFGQLRLPSTFGVEGVGEIILDWETSRIYKVTGFTNTNNFTTEFFATANDKFLYDVYGYICTYKPSVYTKLQLKNAGLCVVGAGSMSGGDSGVTKAGDIYFNTNVNCLYLCVKYNSSTSFVQIGLGEPIEGGVYNYQGQLCKYENNSFVPIVIGNPFDGKKMYVLGDSIAQGGSMGVPSGATQCYQPFPALIAKGLGMQLTNYAIGGSTIAVSPLTLGGSEKAFGGFVTSWSETDKDTSKYYVLLTGSPSATGVGNYGGTTYYYNGSAWVTSNIASRTPISERYKTMGNDADIVFVFCGTNDFQYNWTPIGTIADTEPNTFYGSIKVLCEGLLQKYFGKPIIFCTPIKRCQTQTTTSDTTPHNGGSYGTIDSQNTFSKTLKDYGDIIKEVCARYSIPVIDCYAEGGLNPQLSSQALLFDLYKTHPTQAGHEKLAKYLSGKIQSLYGEIEY